MGYKRWVRIYLGVVLCIIGLFGFFNYAIDPLWTFCHSHRYNNAQPGFDERQQKTNRAYFCGLEQYNALLLGSSRTTYINQHDFAPLRVFNYASVSMYPSEYDGWITVAETIKGKPFDVIILGVDFFGSNAGPFGKQQMHDTPPASYYFDKTRSFLYRWKMLFSMDTFRKSIESVRHSFIPGTVDYTRENVKKTIHISNKRKQQAIVHQVQLHAVWVYGKRYRFNTQLKNILHSLKKKHADSKFIVFTSPISSELFKLMVKSGNLPDYERWLRTLVETFGMVYDFMGINSITSDPNNYADLHHFYPDIGRLIAHRIMNTNDSNIPSDFGIAVTKENLEAHLQEIRRQAAPYLPKKKSP
jgi:hypothetical protein